MLWRVPLTRIARLRAQSALSPQAGRVKSRHSQVMVPIKETISTSQRGCADGALRHPSCCDDLRRAGRRLDPGQEQPDDLLNRARGAEQVALHVVAAQLADLVPL